MQESDDAVAQAWERYAANPNDLKSFNIIFYHYSKLPEYAARSFARKRPAIFEHEDLVSAGNIGLMDAIRKYNPSKGAKFSTYAKFRINGAILDEINGLDWTPRETRRSIRLYLEAERKLQQESNTEPTVQQIADHMGISVDNVRTIQRQAQRTFILPVETTMMSDMESGSIDEARSFVSLSPMLETKDQFWREARLHLPDVEFFALYLRYVEELTMARASNRMGLSVPRYRKLLKDSTKMLQKALGIPDQDESRSDPDASGTGSTAH